MKNLNLEIKDLATREINPDMIGLFFEDINFAADGGLYAEMIENRSFEAVKSLGENRNYVLQDDNLYAWTATDKSGVLEISNNSPVNNNNPHYLRFTAKKAGAGFANKAYDGIVLKKNQKFNVSFYAREVDYFRGDIEIRIKKGRKIYAEARVTPVVAETTQPDGYDVMIGNVEAKIWRKYSTVLIAEDDVKGATFQMHLSKKGCVEFDLISMIPDNAVAGVFRKDLFETLADIHPGFVRFPGGCIVEGTSLLRRYRWKDTVGSIEQRKINTNLWALQGGNTMTGWEMPDSHYMQSYGIGFYEYFLLCELLSSPERLCKPLPVINIGVACQFRSYETVPVESDDFEEYINDALDLIEFANGDTSTKWGSLRAKMGHPESFNLELLAIGNEQWESRQVDLYERYRRFEKAIHDKYPDIKCLGTAGPFVNNELHKDAWKYYYDEIRKNSKFTYAVDEHYYMAPQWMYDNVDFYDDYPRDVAVFAGEYAGHDDNLSNSLEAALSEAAMMTGMERNGDVVKLASYAPLFNRIGHTHWTPDMIWFDEDSVTLTPSYYVQKLFSDYSGYEAFDLKDQEKKLRDSKIYVSAVKSGKGTIIKFVNSSDKDQSVKLTGADGKAVNCEAETVKLVAKAKKAKKVKATAGIDPKGPCKAVSVDSMTNRKLCEYRFPEEVIYEIDKMEIKGNIKLPAKSVMAVII